METIDRRNRGIVKAINKSQLMVALKPKTKADKLSDEQFKRYLEDLKGIQKLGENVRMTWSKRRKCWTVTKSDRVEEYLKGLAERWDFQYQTQTSPASPDKVKEYLANGGTITRVPVIRRKSK